MNAGQKAEFVSMAKRHYELDILLRGTYGFDYFHPHQGCSIGCFNNDLGNDTADYQSLADHFGLPLWLVYLQDFSFEAVGKDFHVAFAESLPITTDWHPVYCAVFGRVLREMVLPVAGSSQSVVTQVLALCDQCETDHKKWAAARAAASVAAVGVARAAARAAESVAADGDATRDAARAVAADTPRGIRAAAMTSEWAAVNAARDDAKKKIVRIVLEELKAAQSQHTF